MVGFYVFMLICTLLIPAVMLFFGYRWKKHVPTKVNHLYGYRSKRSMSSEKAWLFAHRYFAKFWVKSGWMTGFATVFLMLILAFVTLDIAVVGTVGGAIVILQLIPMLIPVFLTEQALKKEFGL